jgi:hypothetical protein
MNVEPSLSYTGEGVLNDFLKSSNPALLTGVKLDLSNARGLYLLEFFDTEGLTLHGNIEDTVVMEELIAFSSDVHHGLDNFFLNEEGVKAEVGELLGEIMLWDWDHAIVRDFPTRGLRR